MLGRTRRVDPRATILAFGTLLLILLVGGIGFEDFRAYEQTQSIAKRDLANYARLFEAHTRSTILGLDQVVMHLKAEYEDDPKHFNLKSLVARSPILKGLSVQVGLIDSEGYLLATTSDTPTVPKIFLGDREHYKVHANADGRGLFISKPVLGRASGKWSIQLARRLNDKKGQFAGVVVVSLDPGYIAQVYDKIDLGSDSVIALVGQDGILRAHASGSDRTVGQDFSSASIFQRLWTEEEAYSEGISPIDRVGRAWYFKRVLGYPLTVLVSRPLERMSEVYRHEHTLFIAAGLAGILLVCGGTALLIHGASHQLSVEQSLRSSESDLLASKERLTRSNDELRRFAHVIAHDLQEPLRNISSYAQLIEQRYKNRLDADADQFIYFMVSGAASMKKRLLDLLDYTLIDQNPAENEIISLNMTLKSVEADLAVRFSELKAQILIGELPCVYGSRKHLELLFYHLLANALDYRHPDRPPKIEVSAHALKDGFWEIAVEDNGIGIEPQYFERIFVLFQRLHAGPEYPGTGMGLALCKKIVEMLGGSIHVESEPGKGSRFLLTLQASPQNI